MCCYVHSAIFCSVNVFPAQICYISLCLVEFFFFYESSVLSCSFLTALTVSFFFFSCLLNIPFGSVQFCSVFFFKFCSLLFCYILLCSFLFKCLFSLLCSVLFSLLYFWVFVLIKFVILPYVEFISGVFC